MNNDLIVQANRKHCSCGKSHSVPVRRIIIGENALEKGCEAIRARFEKGNIVFIGDNNTFEAARKQCETALSGSEISVDFTSLGDDVVSCNETVIGKALIGIPDNAEGIVSLGSGTITDTVRYVAHRIDRPFVSIATAPSMDGYASSIAPAIVDGLKVSLPAKAPELIIADTETCKKAPRRMIASGYGDLFGKYTVHLDWVLSKTVNDEYYCDYTNSLVYTTLNELASRLHSSTSEEAATDGALIQLLFEGLITSGLAISMIGYSRAASGSEHIFSHFIEFKALQHDIEKYFHGESVALGTWIMVHLYHTLFLRGFEYIDTAYETAAKTCGQEAGKGYSEAVRKRSETLEWGYGKYAEKMVRHWKHSRPEPALLEKRMQRLQEKWEYLQEQVATKLPAPDTFSQLCEKAGVPYKPHHFGFNADFIRKSVVCSKEMRDRYTILNLLDDLGILEELLEEVAPTL